MRLENRAYIAIVDGGPWVDKAGIYVVVGRCALVETAPYRHRTGREKMVDALRTPISLIKEKKTARIRCSSPHLRITTACRTGWSAS